MSEHYRRFDDSISGKIVKMWPIAIAIVTLIYAVGTTTTTITQIEKQINDNCELDSIQEQRLTSVEEGRRNIEKRLDRMEDKLDKILRAVK